MNNNEVIYLYSILEKVKDGKMKTLDAMYTILDIPGIKKE